MSRRKTNNVVEDIIGIAAALPWWVGISLAAIAYGVLHHYAGIEVPRQVVPEPIDHVVLHAAQAGKTQVIQTMTFFGQYVVPGLLLIGSAVSFFERRKRAGLLEGVRLGAPGRSLHDLSWREFEIMVGEAFRMRGFSVIETGGGGPDGGIDLVLRKGGETFLVQCKQWRADKVPVKVVRELCGVMTARGAAGGFVVTSGVFTADAQAFVQKLNIEVQRRNIELIDGEALKVMAQKARTVRTAPKSAEKSAENGAAHAILNDSVTSKGNPLCPRCGDTMVKRTARKGANQGQVFWGCSTFPQCRGIRAIEP